MSDASRPSPKDAARLLYELKRSRQGEHIRVSEGELDPKLALLRTWQVERLTEIYADLLDNPRFKPACQFFLDDLYAPRDFTQRDHDIERIYHFMQRFLPERMLHTVALAIELNTLTAELDAALLSVLVDELDMQDSLSQEMVAAAYRLCDNYDDRERQIALIVEVGQAVDRLTRLPLIGTSLRVARGPANQAGWFELQGFLERGLAAFKHMRGARKFLRLVSTRERLILDNIFAEVPNPFSIPLEQ